MAGVVKREERGRRGPGSHRRDHRVSGVAEALRRTEVRPRKERGQNFVIDPAVPVAIAAAAPPGPDDHVVEIGPGLGALTEILAPSAGRLTLVEIEPRFCEELSARFPSATVVNRDVRGLDFSTLGDDLVVFGNLPYVFSTDILFGILDNYRSVRRAVLLLQREFSERVGAVPGGRDYGVLSVTAQTQCDVTLGPLVPGSAFHPPTKVESRVLVLDVLREPRVPHAELRHFRRVVKAAFSQRRKKIRNSLRSSGMFAPADVDRALSDARFDPGRRAETFSREEFVLLARAIPEKGGGPGAEESGPATGPSDSHKERDAGP